MNGQRKWRVVELRSTKVKGGMGRENREDLREKERVVEAKGKKVEVDQG